MGRVPAHSRVKVSVEVAVEAAVMVALSLVVSVAVPTALSATVPEVISVEVPSLPVLSIATDFPVYLVVSAAVNVMVALNGSTVCETTVRSHDAEAVIATVYFASVTLSA